PLAATLDQAQDLGTLVAGTPVEATGTVGPAGTAAVHWYSFTLANAAAVVLHTAAPPQGSPVAAAVSLYNSDGSFGDLYDPLGHRLLAQATEAAPGAGAAITRRLAAGTYYVAVSGAGDASFNPFVAGSGYPGGTGNYDLVATASDLNLDPAAPPVALSVDATPLVVRVDLSAPLGPDQNVQLTDAGGQALALAWSNFSTDATELQLAAAVALVPGAYHVSVTDSGGQRLFATRLQGPGGPGDSAAS